MADRFKMLKHPYGAFIIEKVVDTFNNWFEFFKSPDFQYNAGKREDVTLRAGDIDAGNYFEVQDDGTLHLAGDATRTWLAYGELYEHDAALQIAFTGAEWKDVAGYSDTGQSLNVTLNKTTGEMTIGASGAGMYHMAWNISAERSAGAGSTELHGAVWADSGGGYTEEHHAAARRTISASGFGNFGSLGLHRFSVGDKLKLRLHSSAAMTVDLDHVVIAIHKIGE